MRFGISTHLYHDRPLAPEHLKELAEFGFRQVELFATIGHFDYHDQAAIEALAGWLRDAGLDLHSVHAPIVEHRWHGRVGGGALHGVLGRRRSRARGRRSAWPPSRSRGRSRSATWSSTSASRTTSIRRPEPTPAWPRGAASRNSRRPRCPSASRSPSS